MGHTVSSQRIVLDRILGELKQYAQALPAEDAVYLEQALRAPLKRVAPLVNASSLNAWALILLGVLIEHEKQLAHGCMERREPAQSMDKNSS